jgi:hypothetical protein
MGNDEMRKNEGYCKLKDLCLDFVEYDGTFSFCFWIYLTKSTTFPTTILHQVNHFSLSLFFSFLFRITVSLDLSFHLVKGFQIYNDQFVTFVFSDSSSCTF